MQRQHLNVNALTLALELWAEQIRRGMGRPGESADPDNIEAWLGNRTYQASTLNDAAGGDVAALAQVRDEAGLPVL